MSNYEVNKYGRAGDVDAAGDVYDVSTGDYEFPTVAFETGIVGLANDIPSSDGIHTVQVEGLDINGAEIIEVATLNGATPVVLANSYYRVNRAYVRAVGASLVNSGNISVTHTGSATLARISPQEGQTLQAIFTMPAGIRGHVESWRATAARVANKTDVAATIKLQTRIAGEGWRTKDTFEVVNGTNANRAFGTKTTIIKPLMDVRLRVTDINTDDVAVSGGFEIKGFRDIR